MVDLDLIRMQGLGGELAIDLLRNPGREGDRTSIYWDIKVLRGFYLDLLWDQGLEGVEPWFNEKSSYERVRTLIKEESSS